MAFTYSGAMVDLGFGRGWLDTAPAASIRRIDRALGHPLQITEAGRTWLRQDEHYQHYLRYGSPIALSPDAPSIHQKGAAADSDEGQTIVAFMAEHGWRRTVYRWVNGVWTLVERWHFEYFISLDTHLHDPAPAGGGEAPAPKLPEYWETPYGRDTKEKDMLAVRINDGAGKFGAAGKMRTYTIGGGFFVETTDHPSANEASVIINGYDAQGNPAPSPNLTYAELYAYAKASGALSEAELAPFKAAAGL